MYLLTDGKMPMIYRVFIIIILSWGFCSAGYHISKPTATELASSVSSAACTEVIVNGKPFKIIARY